MNEIRAVALAARQEPAVEIGRENALFVGMNATRARSLPLMKSVEEAVALSEKEHDGFYLTAFGIQAWLGTLVERAAAEYAEHKHAKDRSMQTGQAWKGFLDLFGGVTDGEFPQVLSSLLRFANYEDDSMAWILRRALVPLSIEHDCSGDYIGPKTVDIAKRPKEGVALGRRSVERWCDWIDAAVHFQTHEYWHLAPARFDPDPDKRELAALGAIQRRWPHHSDSKKAWWQWHHSEAAERFKDSPKWPTLGEGMASNAVRVWPYPEVDTMAISLWPLVKRHNWTYCDLLNVVRTAVKFPGSYPCRSEQEFATYCIYILGLRKTGHGKTAKDGRPKGHDVAVRLCPPHQAAA